MLWRDNPAHVGFSNGVQAFDFERLPVLIVVQPTAVNLKGVVEMDIDILPNQIGKQVMLGPDAQEVKKFTKARGIPPLFRLTIQ